MTMAKQLEIDPKYVRWELTANIKNVKLSAQCITEEHKEKTLNHWTKLRAKNIQVVEHPDAARLPLWRVSMPGNDGPVYITIEARTKWAAEDKLRGNKAFKKWQVNSARIEEISREEENLRKELENAKQVDMFACEETPVIERPEVTTEEIAPVTIETEPTTAPIEQPVQPVTIQTNAFKSAEQFSARFRLACSTATADHLNATYFGYRLAGIRDIVECLCKTAIYGDAAFPHGYNAAAYGLWWVVNRRIIDSETYLALKEMTAAQLCELIHTMLVEAGENAGDYAQWLMNRFSSKQDQTKPATQEEKQVAKALYHRTEEHESLAVEVLPSEIKHFTAPIEPINQPDTEMSPIEVTHESNISPEKSACTKTLDTIVNIRHNIDTTITLDHTKEKAMQVMTTDEITLSPEQQAIFNLIENTKENAFITGKAGTGKSVLIRHFKANTKKKAAFVAPTGVAALNIKASTIHSMFKLDQQFQQRWNLSPDEKLNTLLRNLDVLVIDEISMVRCDILDAINWRFQQAMENDLPFGGKQVVMIGDVYQLPPVLDRSDDFQKAFKKIYAGGFFFDALVWQNGGTFKVFELTQVFRQKDPTFRDALNAMRDGTITDEQLAALNSRHGVDVPVGIECITLGSTNKIVADINQQQLDQLPGPVKRYYATIWGNMKQSNFPTEEILQLKEGAQIMMLKNNKDKGWVNGTLGIIEKLSDDSIEVSIAGKSHTIERETWEEIEYRYDEERDELTSRVTSSFTQYPVKLAWGMTIHKSQGQTYQQVKIDLTSGVFAAGQMYVALSRATSLEGLYLKRPILRKHVMVDARVKQFMSRVETIVIEEAPVIVDATPVIEAAEEIIQIAQNGTVEPQIEAVTPESEETPPVKSNKGRKAKSEDEKVIKTDTRLDPMIREGLDRLMKKLESKETTAEERARMIPHSTHQIPTISDVVMEALLNLPAFREVNPELEAAYEEKKRGKKK